MHPLRLVPIVSLVCLVLFWAAAAAAQAEHDHSAHEHGGGAAPAADTLAGAWQALQAERDAISADVEAGKLKEIHAKSERLAPLAQALLDRSKDLTADKRTRVESAVRQMPKAAGTLHAAADKGDAAATRRELGRLDGLLQLIRAQYPPAALAPAGAHSGHEGHSQAAPPHAHAHARGAGPLAKVDADPRATLRVRASEYDFQPRTLQVRAGEATRIEFANDGAIEHSLVVKAPGEASDWIHLHPGPKQVDAATYRLDQPGEYPLLCTIPGHTEAGMVGVVVVQQ